MKRLKVTLFSLIPLFSLSFFTISSPSAEPELGGGRISLVQGQVLIQTREGREWTEATVNLPLLDGDRVVTERDGKVEFHFKSGTYVRVGEESELDIAELYFDQGQETIRLNLLEGRIYANHPATARKKFSLYVDLPYGVARVYGFSKFRIDLTPFEATISVSGGSIEFGRDGRPIRLAKGEVLTVREGGFTEVAQLYERDEWDRWNEVRDNELAQRQYAERHLPLDLEPWGYEMEGHGRWVHTPDYQFVWVPTVVVGWVPFRHGRWTWRRGFYCWVPYERWGWVPFHYGRWVHIHIHGWVWVPPFRHAVIWHPGAVAWYIGPRHISWIPLAPGEIYYGHRHYGPYSVNINRGKINVQKNIFVNAKVKDAVVSVDKDSFFKRSPVKVARVENPFLRPVKVSGPPTEKPIILDGLRKPSRPIKEFIEKVRPEKRRSPTEWRKDIPPVEKEPKVIEQKRTRGSPEKGFPSDSIRNRSEGGRTPHSFQGRVERRDSIPVRMRERENVENPRPIRENVRRREVSASSQHPQSLSSTPGARPPAVRQSFPVEGLPHSSSGKDHAIRQPPKPREGSSLPFPLRSFR